MKILEFVRKHKIAVIIFVLAISVRLALFFVNLNVHGNFEDTIAGADGYYEISQNLLLGNGYSKEAGPDFAPNPLRPPAWIFTMALIAGLFGSYVPVFIFEIIISSLIPILGMYLATRVISWRLSILVGVLLALEPNAVLYSFLTISETFFTFLLLIFSLWLFRYFDRPTLRNAIWSGLFLGLAILVKPTVQFLVIIIPIVFLVYCPSNWRIRFTQAIGFVAVCVLLILPWGYRNYHEFGGWGISAQAAFNLYSVLVPTVLAIENNTDFKTERTALVFPADLTDGDINTGNASYFTSQALVVLSEHKLALAKSMGMSLATFFTHDGLLSILEDAGVVVPNFLEKPAVVLLFKEPLELIRRIGEYSTTPGVLILLGRLFWIMVTVFLLVGSWLYFKREKLTPHAVYALAIVTYFALLTMVNGFGMNARFRQPINGFIFIFALYGFAIFWRQIKRRLISKYA